VKKAAVTLFWKGKKDSRDCVVNERLPEVSLAEHGRGCLVQGDNLAALKSLLPDFASKVMLAYLDPPFLTNRAFEAIVPSDIAPKDRGPLKAREKRFAFDDRWSGRAEYLASLGQRLEFVRELLAPNGSVVIHVDPKTSHYVKVLGDEIFGDDAFASEIIWRYRRWPSKTLNFQRVHDVLLRFRKDPKIKPRFNMTYEPLAPSTVATWGRNKQRAVFEANGRRKRSETTDEATKGVPMGDVWDIGVIAPMSRERTGYPSQKPEALLDRLVTALTCPGDIVLDPYMGSGTTLVVAAKRERMFVGIDESEVAHEIARTRLSSLGVRFGITPISPAPPVARSA